jgi:cyanophycinase
MKNILLLLFVMIIGINSNSQTSPANGKLIIIGGGDIPDTIYSIFATHCGGKDQPIVVIPTATGDEEWIRSGGHLKKFSDRGFTNLTTIHTREKAKADDPEFLKAVSNAKGIFFGGGDQERLAQAYAGTALHKAMLELLNRGGAIMGTSAGATIMGSVLIGGDHRKSPNKKHEFPAGLAFIDKTAIDQHVLVRNRQFDLLPTTYKQIIYQRFY